MMGGEVVAVNDEGVEVPLADRRPELRRHHRKKAADAPPGGRFAHELWRIAVEQVDVPFHGLAEAAVVATLNGEIG